MIRWVGDGVFSSPGAFGFYPVNRRFQDPLRRARMLGAWQRARAGRTAVALSARRGSPASPKETLGSPPPPPPPPPPPRGNDIITMHRARTGRDENRDEKSQMASRPQRRSRAGARPGTRRGNAFRRLGRRPGGERPVGGPGRHRSHSRQRIRLGPQRRALFRLQLRGGQRAHRLLRCRQHARVGNIDRRPELQPCQRPGSAARHQRRGARRTLGRPGVVDSALGSGSSIRSTCRDSARRHHRSGGGREDGQRRLDDHHLVGPLRPRIAGCDEEPVRLDVYINYVSAPKGKLYWRKLFDINTEHELPISHLIDGTPTVVPDTHNHFPGPRSRR